jgi:dipeptidyl aminopeptidase/acylaminoacyl peptidase
LVPGTGVALLTTIAFIASKGGGQRRKTMKGVKEALWFFGLAFTLFLPCSWPAYGQASVSITEVLTTDYAGNPKTIFHPGDNVRYHVTFDLTVAEETNVIARGVAKGQKVKPGGVEGTFKTELEKQGKGLTAGLHTFSWDESVPITALPGRVSFKIRVRVRDGGEDTEWGVFSVEEAPSKIAFVREEIVLIEDQPVENRDVWLMNPDGTDLVQLTSDISDDRLPSISPNGMQIAFASDRTGNFDIWLLDLETGELTQLTDHPADDTQPTWSPDGKRIAFTSERAGSKDVWVVDVDYGTLEQLTYSNFIEKGPQWAPNGKRIAFVSDRDGNDDVFKMKPGGRKKEQLTYDLGDQRAAAWSPTSKEIAFTWWEFPRSRANIYAMDKDGGNVRQLTSRNFYDRGPIWSPNGARIAFYSNRSGNFDIWTMGADGTDMVQITAHTAKESAPDWKKAGFSDEWTTDLEITGKGRENIAYVGTIHLARGGTVRVEISWDDEADLELGILEPSGDLITWKNPEGFGRHKGNVNPGPGTEVYTLSGAARGDYLIGAYCNNYGTTAHWRVRWRDGSLEQTSTEPQ